MAMTSAEKQAAYRDRQKAFAENGKTGSPGLNLPPEWGDLPASASIEAELEWVHENRVWVIGKGPGGRPHYNWNLAQKPPPSRGAIAWMVDAAIDAKGFREMYFRVKKGSEDGDESAAKKAEWRSVEEVRKVLAKFVAAKEAGNQPTLVDGTARA